MAKQTWPRTTVFPFGRRLPAWGCCIVTGIALGTAGIGLLAAARGASASSAALSAALPAGAVVALAFITKVVRGYERFTFFHYVAAALAAGATGAAWRGLDVAAELDAVAIGVAVAQLFGRIGCWLGGCCHGRPHRLGLAYPPTYEDTGLPVPLLGRRLFPTQLVDGACAGLTAAAALFAWATQPAGSAFVLVVAATMGARFILEGLRGDRRPSAFGLSEARWTALASWAALLGAGVLGLLPAWATIASLVAGSLAITISFAIAPNRFLQGDHLVEVAGLLADARRLGARVVLASSQGLQLASERRDTPDGIVAHVSVSAPGAQLDERTVARLGSVIGLLFDRRDPPRIHAGRRGVFHLLFEPA